MSTASVGTHISQPSNIIAHLPLCIVLDRHVGQLGGNLSDGTLWDVSDLGEGVDAELGEDARGSLRTESIERLERLLEETLLGEVDAEDEDLWLSVVGLVTEDKVWANAPF